MGKVTKIRPITKFDESEFEGQELIDKLDTADFQQVIRIARRTANDKDHSTTIQFRAPKVYARFTEIFRERARCKIETLSDASRSIYLLGMKTAKEFIDKRGKIGDEVDDMIALNERLEDMLSRQHSYEHYGNLLKRLKEYLRPYRKNKIVLDSKITAIRIDIEKVPDEFLKQDLLKKFERKIQKIGEELESDIEEDS